VQLAEVGKRLSLAWAYITGRFILIQQVAESVPVLSLYRDTGWSKDCVIDNSSWPAVCVCHNATIPLVPMVRTAKSTRLELDQPVIVSKRLPDAMLVPQASANVQAPKSITPLGQTNTVGLVRVRSFAKFARKIEAAYPQRLSRKSHFLIRHRYRINALCSVR